MMKGCAVKSLQCIKVFMLSKITCHIIPSTRPPGIFRYIQNILLLKGISESRLKNWALFLPNLSLISIDGKKGGLTLVKSYHRTHFIFHHLQLGSSQTLSSTMLTQLPPASKDQLLNAKLSTNPTQYFRDVENSGFSDITLKFCLSE